MQNKKSLLVHGFTYRDRLRLQKALEQTTDKRIFVRLQAVLLFCQGIPITDIVQIAHKGKRTIYYWVSRYLLHRRVDALFDKPRSGRPITAQDVTDELILQQLRRNPLELGYHAGTWTVALLARHLKLDFDHNITARTLRRRMKHIGLRFKRPRYVYSEKDPNRSQKKGLSSES